MEDPRSYASLVDLLDQSLVRHRDRTACVSFGHSTSYARLDDLANQWAYWLASLGLPAQSRVAIMLPNVTASLVALLGTLRAGHVVVNINPLYTARELAMQLRDSESQVIVVFEAFAHTLSQLPQRDQPSHQVVVRAGELLPGLKSGLVNLVAKYVKRGVKPWQLRSAIMFAQALETGRLCLAGRDSGGPGGQLTLPEIKSDDLAFIQYTGGTTGEPRGAMLTHGNLVANILQVGEVAQPAIGHMLHRSLTMLTALPLYHVFAMTVCALYSMYAGMRIVLVINARDLDALVKVWKACPPEIFPGVNTLFNALLRHEGFRNMTFSGLRLTLGGGMAVHESVAEQWQKLTSRPIIQGYGMSETSPVICASQTDATRFTGSVGKPLPMTEIRVLDDHRQAVLTGEIGEIAVRGPQVMAGYWHAPDATKACMTADGFFLTGDLGFVDQDGCVTLVDRKKDMVLVSGFNVYPAEIDAVFAEHPDVLECAAVGYPDAQSGEAIKLFVVPRVADIDKASLARWSEHRLTPYKRPREFVLVDSLPKNAVGKTLRRILRQTYT